jgi:hypothetical protein
VPESTEGVGVGGDVGAHDSQPVERLEEAGAEMVSVMPV